VDQLSPIAAAQTQREQQQGGPLDQLGRPLQDLRISLTDRCNLRCRYCMPAEVFGPSYAFLPREQLLNASEILRVARCAASLGVKKLRLTGGEPLLRRDLTRIVSLLVNESGIADIALTTNGLLLADKAKALKDAGLKRVNLSLDAIDESIFQRMSGGLGTAEKVITAARRCAELQLPFKINAVVKRDMNTRELIPLLLFAKGLGVEIRFIEYMDVGASNDWSPQKVFSEKEILGELEARFGKAVPLPTSPFSVAREYELVEQNYRFGIIASITRPFCAGCVRARLSSDGKLFTCLFSEQGHDLRALLRSSATDRELFEAMRGIWHQRRDRYSELRGQQPQPPKRIEMSYIGG
jgi:cyclic pyranopterin phosphate synthase